MWWKIKLKVLVCAVSLLFSITAVHAQELFIISEPASNIPAKAVAMRITNKFMNGKRLIHEGHYSTDGMQRLVPEIGIGINKSFNLRWSGFIANYYQNSLKLEGFNLYAKYRFFSSDDKHQHFRMAAFSRVSVVDHPFYFNEINLEGDNSGINTGIVATQLLHKLAISATVGHVYTMDNIGYELPQTVTTNNISYLISAGYLLLPFHYKNYLQPNLNVYCEFHGRNDLEGKNTYIYDVFPALQLILKSYMRIDMGYRMQLSSNISRNASSGFLLRFEYNLFNALK